MGKRVSEVSYFMGALLVPWRLASLLFIAIFAILLDFFEGKGVFGIVWSSVLFSWFFKYAFVTLEHVANGHLDAPVVSAEMLGPFEQRPLILVAWCLVLYVIARFLGHPVGVALAAGLMLLLPAAVAVLGLGRGILESVNPQQLWRMARGLGRYYLGILGLIGAAIILAAALGKWGAWNIWIIAIAQVTVLTVFSAIGGALFEKRWEIGHEPQVSPERQMEKEDREHARALGAMLDQVYSETRQSKPQAALQALTQWLTRTDDRHIVADTRTIVGRVDTWDYPDVVAPVRQALVMELGKRGFYVAATDIQKSSLKVGAPRRP